MSAVWSLGPDPVRVRDVADALNAGRKRALAYNTVQTVLTLLLEKGALELVEAPGRAHFYRAKLTRDAASRGMLRDLVERLFDGRVQPLLQQLVNDEKLGDEDLRRLREWVDARLQDRGEGRS